MSRAILYSRELPGGGFVAIDSLLHGGGLHARLWVERRADTSRRTGHLPPIIAECEATDEASALAALQPLAGDNLSLAKAIRRWQASRRS